MTEGLGLAGMTETPIVVVDGQRPGPAVGLPTRSEQGDLEFVIHAHHGEFPRSVFAPADVADAFWLTVKAFNIADKYQTPAIILNDHYLATCYMTVAPFDLSKIKIDRGEFYSSEEPGNAADYKRHKVTASGVSPRALPGQRNALVVTDADEHGEDGHIIEDAATRKAQVEKRLRKLDGMRQEITPPRRYGPDNAETTLIGWGSTWGALREAVDTLNHDGKKANLLQFSELWPFPAEAVNAMFKNGNEKIVVENNATGQLAHLIRAETGIKADGYVRKYDGRPFTASIILDGLKKEAG